MAEPRARPAPRERFEDPAMTFDLAGELAALRAEPTPSHQGHRQKTLIKRGGHTVALFSFEGGAELSEHSTDGYVTIHTLEGELAVTVAGEQTRLAPGALLAMNPNVKHDLRAESRAAFLLQVSLKE